MDDVKFIRVEERTMAARFGEVWREYKDRVRRWI
jgi:protein-S-isoprenylcysteine O-methyltransferase Ste14